MATNENVGELLDSLYLEMLFLIEQKAECKVNIEKHINSGKLLLAKARYVQGQQSVGSAQLPTENSAEFYSLCRTEGVHDSKSLTGTELKLKKYSVDKEAGRVDPINWFGFLVTRSLHVARHQFQTSIDLVVECANIQKQLQSIMNCITKLKSVKATFMD